jgi:YVTN family beta-propeller protein
MPRLLFVTLVVLAAACSPTTTTNNPPPGGHPSGAIRLGTNIPGHPTGIAINDSGIVYATENDLGKVGRFVLPSFALTSTVIAVGTKPVDVAFAPNGNTAYVANNSDNSVSVVDVATNTQTTTIPVSGKPLRVAVSPDGATLYVGLDDGLLGIISTATNTGVFLTMPGTLNGLGFSPTQPILYVSSEEGTVYELNTTSGSIARSFTIDGAAEEVVVSKNGATLFVANRTGQLQIRSTSTLDSLGTVFNVIGAYGMALTPDGTQLYISRPPNGYVLVMDVASTFLVDSVLVGEPQRIAFTADGSTAAIANKGGTVIWVQ